MIPDKIKHKVCPNCGNDVYMQADLSWNDDTQDWAVVWTNHQIHCASCHHEFSLKDIKDIV